MGKVTDAMVNDLRTIETEVEFPQCRKDMKRNPMTQQATPGITQTKTPRNR